MFFQPFSFYLKLTINGAVKCISREDISLSMSNHLCVFGCMSACKHLPMSVHVNRVLENVFFFFAAKRHFQFTQFMVPKLRFIRRFTFC